MNALEKLGLGANGFIWGAVIFFFVFVYSYGVDVMKAWSGSCSFVLLVTLMAVVFCFVMSVRFAPTKKAAGFWTLSLVGFVPLIILLFAIIYSDGMVKDSNSFLAADYLYYSVVTFTTLGYGDFQPNPDARLIASLQAFLGFTFVPILISEFLALTNKFRN